MPVQSEMIVVLLRRCQLARALRLVSVGVVLR
jgi:hypothetical protein